MTAHLDPKRRRWLALGVLCLGVLMIVLDTTIVNVALPSIRADLHFTETSLVWVVNAYMLTFGGFLLLGGRIGDLYGSRKLYLLGLVFFTIASVGCGLANTQELLIAARAIQGLGGGFISSVAYDELRNVLLPNGSGDQIHVNYLLLTQKGLLLIDLFDTHGMIFAGEKMGQWSIFGPKRHFMIANPLPMLYDRIAAVRQFAGDDVAVEGRIVFSMRGEFPKGRPEDVIRLDELQDQYPVVEKSPGGAAANSHLTLGESRV